MLCADVITDCSVSLTPEELVLRRNRPLHQFGSDQACAQPVCVFCVVLTTHTQVNTHCLSDVTHVVKHKVCVRGQKLQQMFLSDMRNRKLNYCEKRVRYPRDQMHDGIDVRGERQK